MSVRIGSNISSLKAQRQLNKATADVSSIYERLSSGLRINKASDDAAGLSVLSTLNSDKRVFTQGIRNFNDGISLLNIADGTIQELTNITTRLKELAEQAANGTYGTTQRKALDAEAQALSKEYFRIQRSTTFNGRGLFFSEFGQLRVQGGYGRDGGIQSGLGGAIGTANFAADTSYSEVAGGYDITTGDLNGDSALDIVTIGTSGTGLAAIRLGRGDGTFGSRTTYSMNSSSSASVALGDFNGDGILDLATGGLGAASSSTAAIRLGIGDGSFGAIISLQTTMTDHSDITLGDLNNDGKMDLLLYGQDGSVAGYRTFLGQGNGQLTAAASGSTVSGLADQAVLGDVNNDGILDLASKAESAVSVSLGLGNGNFGTAAQYYGTITGIAIDDGDIKLGDLNNDGKLDIVVGGDNGAGEEQIQVKLGNGDGTFGTSISFVTGIGAANVYSLDLGDVNGDGNLDLLFDGGGSTLISLGTGSGTFGSTTLGGTSNATGSLLADFNNDGVLDIAANGLFVNLQQTTSGISPLLSFKLTSRADSLQALSQFTHTLNRLSAQRGIIGAFQSRLNVGVNTLQSSAENYSAAASRISDADIAFEAANLARTQILQKAAGAVLAQANQQPSIAINLLKSGFEV